MVLLHGQDIVTYYGTLNVINDTRGSLCSSFMFVPRGIFFLWRSVGGKFEEGPRQPMTYDPDTIIDSR